MADTVQTGPEKPATEQTPVVVKKYANRRLYNTESSSYITLDNLAEMVRLGRDFVVYDAKSGDDITRSVLTQIIVEEEGKGHNLLPTGFLRQLIGFYGGQMQGLVPNYLEHALTAFTQQQEQMRSAMQATMGTLFPFSGMEGVSRQNLAMMERAFSLFTPFYRPGDTPGAMMPGASLKASAGTPAGTSAGSSHQGTSSPSSNPSVGTPSGAASAAPEHAQAPADDQTEEVAKLRAEVEQLRRELASAKSAQRPSGRGGKNQGRPTDA